MLAFTYADNSEAVDKGLADFQAALADQQPALAAIGEDFREMIAEQFASQGSAEGTPWPQRSTPGGADIARSAMSAKRRPQTRHRAAISAPPDTSHPLLIRTGALLRSLTEPGATGHVAELGDQSRTLGSRLPYALYHQTGTRRLPARPLIVLTEARTERWTEIVRQEIEQKNLLLQANELGGTQL